MGIELLPGQNRSESGQPLPTGLVRKELEAILASRHFRISERLSCFLRLLVMQWLANPQINIKEHQIGIEAFGKPDCFDPRSDATVRVAAARLRERLRKYYLEEGRHHPVQIGLPLRGYSLQVSWRAQVYPEDPPTPGIPTPTLALMPLLASPVKAPSSAAGGIIDALVHALHRCLGSGILDWHVNVPVNRRIQNLRELARFYGAGLALETSIHLFRGSVLLSVRLVDVEDGGLLWSGLYERPANDPPSSQQILANEIARTILGLFSARHSTLGRGTEPSGQTAP